MLPNEMFERVTGAVAAVCAGFTRPQDDFNAMLFLDTPTGSALCPMLFSNPAEKAVVFGKMVPTVIKRSRATIAATLISAWCVRLSPAESKAVMKGAQVAPPSQHPDRQEVLTLMVFTCNSLRSWTASIQRTAGQPPTLGAWVEQPTDVETRGLIADSIQGALRSVVN
jgi:hypothetical protein